jgi:Lon protease-like protein
MEDEGKLLRLFPLSTVLFPGASLNLHVFEPRYMEMMSECLAEGEAFGIVLIQEGAEAGDPDVVSYEVGTVATIVDITPLEHGRIFVSTIGERRFRIVRTVSRDPYILAEVEYFEDGSYNEMHIIELEAEVRAKYREYRRLLVAFSVFSNESDLPCDAAEASFLIADALQVADSVKQRLLELVEVRERFDMELSILRRLVPQLESMIDRRREIQLRREEQSPADAMFRSDQEKYFGKYFSVN